MRRAHPSLLFALLFGCTHSPMGTRHTGDASVSPGRNGGAVGTGGSTSLVGSGGIPSPQTGGTSGGLTVLPAVGGSSGTTIPRTFGMAALSVLPSSINLGTLALGSTGVATVTVSNTGKGTSGTITLVPSAGIAASGCSGPLQNGESCTITIAVTPTLPGAFSGSVQISANPGALTPLVVAVVAAHSGSSGFTVTPSVLDLGNIVVGTWAPRQVITVTASAAITDLSITTSGLDLQMSLAASTCTTSLAAGASCVVAADCLAISTAAKSDGIVITAGGKSITIPIKVNAQNPAELVTSPSKPQYFVIEGDMLPMPVELTVENRGDLATGLIEVSLAGADAADFSTSSNCLVLAPLATCTITVDFRPGAFPGASDAGVTRTATLTVSDTGAGASSVSVPLTGDISTRAYLRLTSESSDLGVVVVGATGPVSMFKAVNMSDNYPSGPLEITISSPEFVLGNDTCSGADLMGRASCTFAVSLKPATAGVKNATLKVSGSNTSPGITMITGMGITPDPSPAQPAALDFGAVTTGTTSPPQTVTITNAGGASTGKLVVKGLGHYAVFIISDSTCTGPLSPGASCSFAVSFAPVQARSESAAITIGDGSTSWTITLSGIGTESDTASP